MSTLRNKLKDPLFITLLVLGGITLICMFLFGGWLLKSIAGLLGFGAAAQGRKTLKQWAEADAERRQRLQAQLEYDRKKREQVRRGFHDQAREQARREAQIERDREKTPDEQREALLKEAREIDGTQ